MIIDWSLLEEPDCEEGIRAVARAVYTSETDAEMTSILRDFARHIRDHERVSLRERPTRPDLTTLPDLGDKGPKAV